MRDASLSGHERDELYRNDGGRFTRIGYAAGADSPLDGRGFVPADFDRDGDVDIFLVNFAGDCVYLENRMAVARRWSVVQLVGSRTNRSGIGSRVLLTAGGRTQTREVHHGSGFLSSPPPEAHFGLGDSLVVERIEIRWPSGERETFENLESNRIIVIEEGRGFRYVSPVRPDAPEEAEEVEIGSPAGRTGSTGRTGRADGDSRAPCASAI